MKIDIYKSDRLLVCTHNDTELLCTKIQLGFGADDGPKCREGDGRTPEGEYFVSSKNPESKFRLALGISYPGPHDAARGLEMDIIGRETYEKICASPKRPPWDTEMGGFVMLHGQNDPPKDGDWTHGCIAVENAVMDAIFPIAAIGDMICIHP